MQILFSPVTSINACLEKIGMIPHSGNLTLENNALLITHKVECFSDCPRHLKNMAKVAVTQQAEAMFLFSKPTEFTNQYSLRGDLIGRFTFNTKEV